MFEFKNNKECIMIQKIVLILNTGLNFLLLSMYNTYMCNIILKFYNLSRLEHSKEVCMFSPSGFKIDIYFCLLLSLTYLSKNKLQQRKII